MRRLLLWIRCAILGHRPLIVAPNCETITIAYAPPISSRGVRVRYEICDRCLALYAHSSKPWTAPNPIEVAPNSPFTSVEMT